MSPITGIAEVNGTRLTYQVMGQGHPLVLIHGRFVDGRMWDDQFKALAEIYQVIRYDVRGAGKSGVPEKPFSHTEDLARLLKLLRVDRAAIVGFSMGGGIAIDFTLEYPDMVSALIAAAPGLGGYHYSDKVVQRVSANFSTAQDEGVSHAVQSILNDPYWAPAPENVAARQKMRQMLTENSHAFRLSPDLSSAPVPPSPERLSEIRVPTLVIAAERDDADNLAVANILETSITGARKVVMAGASHVMSLEKPGEFSGIVIDFLSRNVHTARRHSTNQTATPTSRRQGTGGA